MLVHSVPGMWFNGDVVKGSTLALVEVIPFLKTSRFANRTGKVLGLNGSFWSR